MQQWAQIAGSSAALVAVLVGLARHWEFWSVVERAFVAYLLVFGVVGILLLLGRVALRSEPDPPRESKRNDPEQSRTDGTDAAL
ncbi:MAG TPA: hypothetical protein VKA86_10240 [Candidatus Krumholzibacteria bacterium]|nr:hypothetical protein [Candidatus Krumholzibacteria bacterium]